MASNRLHLSFPHGAPAWARWGRRIRIGEDHYRVGRANDSEAILWRESVHDRKGSSQFSASEKER